MARVCYVCGKRPVTGNNVSHANNKTKRQWKPNLMRKRYFLEEENRWITLRVSAKGIKVIDKRGLATVVREMRGRGIKV